MNILAPVLLFATVFAMAKAGDDFLAGADLGATSEEAVVGAGKKPGEKPKPGAVGATNVNQGDSAGGSDKGGEGGDDGSQGQQTLPPVANEEAFKALFEGDDEVETINPETSSSQRAFAGLRGNYCYDTVGSGIQSRHQCYPENPLKNRKCATRACAYRPTWVKYRSAKGTTHFFRVIQAPFLQHSVGARPCKNPGRVCACKKARFCKKCQKRKTCQNVWDFETHKIGVVVPMLNAPARMVRIKAQVKAPVGCKCVK